MLLGILAGLAEGGFFNSYKEALLKAIRWLFQGSKDYKEVSRVLIYLCSSCSSLSVCQHPKMSI